MFQQSEKILLKKCVVFYQDIGSDNKPDCFPFEKISSICQQRIKTDWIPVLHRGSWFDAKQAGDEVIAYLKNLLTLDENELPFLNLFRQKKYHPEPLFENEEILSHISKHPMALWKCSDRQTQSEFEKN